MADDPNVFLQNLSPQEREVWFRQFGGLGDKPLPQPPTAGDAEQAKALAIAKAAYPNSPQMWPNAAAAVRSDAQRQAATQTATAPQPDRPSLGASDMVGAATATKPEAVQAKADEAKAKDAAKGATFYDTSQAGATGMGLAGPLVMTPGGLRVDEIQTKKGVPESDAEREANTRARELGMTNAMTGQMIGVQKAAIDYGYANTLNKLEQDQGARDRALLDSQQQRQESAMADYEKVNRAILDRQISNPWADRSTGQRILGTVGIALGAAAAAITGGPNQALQAQQAAAQLDMAAREEELAQLRGRAGAAENLLGMQQKIFGSEQAARHAVRASVYRKAMADMQVEASKLGIDAAMLQGSEVVQAVQERIAKEEQAMSQLHGDHIVTTQKYHLPQILGGAGLPKGVGAEVKDLAEAYEKAGIPKALAQLEQIDKRMDAFGKGDIEGIGYGYSMMPEFAKVAGHKLGVISDRAIANQQAFQAVKNEIRHAISGAAVTEAEKPDLNKQLEGAHDAESLRNVVNSFRASVAKRQANLKTIASPVGLAIYGARGGSVRDIPEDKGTVPTIERPEK